MEPGKKTPLWDAHKRLNAKLIDFGGWNMPVSYPAGTIKEHKAVREAVGLFDVSHMGEAYLRGPRAREVVAKLTTNACESAPAGKAVYTLLCRPNGGVVDDCIFYKRSDDDFMVIFNAGNIAKDLDWFREHASTTCDVVDVSDQTALIAVQGPKAAGMVDALSGGDVAAMPSFTWKDTTVAGIKCIAARTGYTGEDGFELACRNEDALALWNALMEAATPLGGLPIGLGARDSLRLESKLPLYGNDLDDDHTPLEAGLGWAVKLDKGDFLGAAALRAQKAEGLKRQLVGFKIDEATRAIARHGYAVVDRSRPEGDQVVGTVTSGGPGIIVGGAIGLAYVPSAQAAPGTKLTIDCRGKDATATVVSGKFYKPQGKK
ncbi:MAG TPA: glycine cleavage system aminomethyltransferase GcvT [Kofleriaceae bacterium]|nr:glycine cleavage system aminomethyltransferase GcvT [Kofleriaceae bacterium]